MRNFLTYNLIYSTKKYNYGSKRFDYVLYNNFFLFFVIDLSQEAIYPYDAAQQQALKKLDLKEVFKKLIFNKKN